MQFKLTNIWSQWPEFWKAVEKEAPSQVDKLSNYWDPSGLFMSDLDESVDGIVRMFKGSSSFINAFDGYDQKEKAGLLNALVSEENVKIIEATIKASFMLHAKSAGKELTDFNYNKSNGLYDDLKTFKDGDGDEVTVFESTQDGDDGKRVFIVDLGKGSDSIRLEFEGEGDSASFLGAFGDTDGDDITDEFEAANPDIAEKVAELYGLKRPINNGLDDDDDVTDEFEDGPEAVNVQEKSVPVSAVPDKSASADAVVEYLNAAMAKTKGCYFTNAKKSVYLPDNLRISDRLLKWVVTCSVPEKAVEGLKKALKAMAIPGLRVNKGPGRGRNAPAYYVVQCPVEETKVVAETDVIRIKPYSEGWSGLGEQDLQYFMDICNQFIAAPDKFTFWDSLRFQILKLVPEDSEDIDAADIGERIAKVKILQQYMKKDQATDKRKTREYNTAAKRNSEGSRALSKLDEDNITYLGSADRKILEKVASDYRLKVLGTIRPKSKIVIDTTDHTETDDSNNRYTFRYYFVSGYISIDGTETEFDKIQIGSSGFDHFPES